jgi:hypothetical protein
MTQNAIRIAAAGVAIAAVAVISLATETPTSAVNPIDPSVPSASTVLHANDGRGAGNVEDKTY